MEYLLPVGSLNKKQGGMKADFCWDPGMLVMLMLYHSRKNAETGVCALGASSTLLAAS